MASEIICRYGRFKFNKTYWRLVPKWEGRYIVSLNGELYDMKNKDIVLLRPDKDGYLRTSLYLDKKQKHFYIHQLVLLAFVGPCPKGLECHHKDNDISNNTLDNLEYIPHLKNMRHRYANNTYKNYNNKKLDEEKVKEIKLMLKNGYKLKDIANKFNIGISTVVHIRYGDIWKHIEI